MGKKAIPNMDLGQNTPPSRHVRNTILHGKPTGFWQDRGDVLL